MRLGSKVGAVAIGVCLGLSGATASTARAVTINFDTDAAGNPLTAPSLFADADPLTTLYASLGVVFAGPAPGDGGAILDESSSFGVTARSGSNFLAFNREATMQNGGTPTGPETLTFSTPVSSVSIYGAGGSNVDTFTMTAFDNLGVVIDTDTVSSQQFAQIEVSAGGPGISSVVLTENGDPFFVYDDLSFIFVPEPASGLVFTAACGLLVGRRRGTPSA